MVVKETMERRAPDKAEEQSWPASYQAMCDDRKLAWTAVQHGRYQEGVRLLDSYRERWVGFRGFTPACREAGIARLLVEDYEGALQEFLAEREEHVGHRRRIGRLEMHVALEHAVAVAEEHQRAAAMVVDVAVGHR